MLEEPQLSSSRNLSPYGEENGDEELSMLPRHTKVVVTGNNRTKSVLVGIQGVVKKAVGLGGWHWLVLKNGIEVKLQKNALSVLEHPTGNEDDNRDFDYSSGSEVCGKDQEFPSKKRANQELALRGHGFHQRQPSHWVEEAIEMFIPSCKDHNRVIPYVVRYLPSSQRVNLARLRTKSLLRYCNHNHLETSNSNLERLQMLHAMQHHFASQRVNEGEVIVDFVRAVEKMKKVNEYDVE